MLRRAPPRKVQKTTLLIDAFEERGIPFEPVNYTVIPPRIHDIDKLVVPYVSLDTRGKMNQELPHFYAVTARPDTKGIDVRSVRKRSQQAHVVAEDISLKRGLMTPYARTNTEQLVAGMISSLSRRGYVDDRIVHLDTLRKEAEQSEQLYDKQRAIIVEELGMAMDGLRALIA